LDDDLWQALHKRAEETGSTVSELVRKAARKEYLGDAQKRKAAMLAVMGLWADRDDLPDTETYIRELRKGTRLDRLRER
jgi:hypothetical protein